MFSIPTDNSSGTHKDVKCFRRGECSEYEQRNYQLRMTSIVRNNSLPLPHSLPGYLFCHRREKQNSRKNQVTIMYTDYCHWLSINLIILSSYTMVPDLPFPVHVFELFPMHATLQENFRGHYEACSSKAGVFNFHCSCLRTLCSKGQNVNQMKTAVLLEADT